jgi:hypothetical protein
MANGSDSYEAQKRDGDQDRTPSDEVKDPNDDVSPMSPQSTAVSPDGAAPEHAVVEERWLTGKKLILVHSAMLLSLVGAPSSSQHATFLTLWLFFLIFHRVLLIALDQTIVATALPRIVSRFNALSSVSWVASGYFLTQVRHNDLFERKLTTAGYPQIVSKIKRLASFFSSAGSFPLRPQNGSSCPPSRCLSSVLSFVVWRPI